MSELQSTIEFSVELYKFYNVDLFQRGMYQIRCSLRVPAKLGAEIEVAAPEVTAGLGSAKVLGSSIGGCRPFWILFRNEEVSLKDVVLFRCHMLVDANNIRESLERADFSLVVDLWFSNRSPIKMTLVSSRTLQLNFSPVEGLHYHLPVIFDYFHLSAVTITIHVALTALHQPSIKKGILRYVQSCAPKSSKSWSKIRTSHSSTLNDPVPKVSSCKIYNKLNETSQILLEAYNILLDSSNSLKSTIKEYKFLLLQRKEIVSDNYDTLIVKYNDYDSTKFLKKPPYKSSSNLDDLCLENTKLWNYFLFTFSCKIAIQQFLSKKHHHLKVHRFAELFFLVYNPRNSIVSCIESKYHKYLLVLEFLKRSKYLQLIPPLPVHCNCLDGESGTMPIIFEDQYQEPVDKKNCSQTFNANEPTTPATVKRSKTVDATNCSCRIEVWQPQKTLQLTMATDQPSWDDFFSNTIPATRHSKSLDHLQITAANSFHISMTNILNSKQQHHHHPQQQLQHKSQQICRKQTLKSVASEHCFKQNEKLYLETQTDLMQQFCNCSVNNFRSLNIRHSSRKYKKNNTGKPIVAKEIENRHDEHSLVKSISQIPIDNISTKVSRWASMQIFSPKKKPNNKKEPKFNSLVNQKIRNQKFRKPSAVNGFDQNKSNSNQNKLTKSKIFDVGSTSSSTESISHQILQNTGSSSSSSNMPNSLRKVRSTSCLDEELYSFWLSSGTESLPNISPKTEEKLCFPKKTKYFSSDGDSSTSSSSSGEQSGWITSRSSSLASSTDTTHPAKSVIESKLDKIQKELLDLSKQTKTFIETNHEFMKDKNALESKTEKTPLSLQNGKKETPIDISLLKGCDLNNETPPLSSYVEDIALPPPKQFRDFVSPSSSIATNEDVDQNEDPLNEMNALDNLLYHTMTENTEQTSETEKKPDENPQAPNQCAVSPVGNTETEPEAEPNSSYKNNTETYKLFLQAKEDFKSQLNFQEGTLYSDLNSFASTVPYFQISDEFRIFSPEGLHLIICVHGLDGNAADLRLIKTYLELGLPGAYLDFLMSERNQGDTFTDFDTMTDRLVREILEYLDTSNIRPSRISFIGHSLGNIIIRSALTRPQMKFLLPRLYTFLSLSGPHLGTLYNSSGLVNMGMWFMQKWKKSGSLQQLCLKDGADPQQSFLYRLSQRSNLQYFKNILLCGSDQDRYVPLHSARIELCKESLKDTSEQGIIYRKMVHNIMQPIIAQKDLKLLRYDIHHALPYTANAIIGRAAHIAVLDSDIFIEKFMAVVGTKYFR